MPSSSSKLLMALDKLGWETWQRSAARPKCASFSSAVMKLSQKHDYGSESEVSLGEVSKYHNHSLRLTEGVSINICLLMVIIANT